jgi:Tol biopolymer transport system component
VKWHKLAWIDLESTASINVAVTDTPDYGQNLQNRENQAAAAMGTAYGLIATGDSNISDVSPSFSHDGTKIVYVATDYSPDGHPDYTATVADVKVVDYNNKAGGTSTPLMGASDSGYLEYYPSFSGDDKFIAFTRAPNPGANSPDGPYYNRFGQIMIVPAAGGTPTQLTSNDPESCAGDNVSAGIINSWPKWSPDVFTAHGKTYYFVIFSSGRKYADEFSSQFPLAKNPASDFAGLQSSSQLYLAAIVVDKTTGMITTYPAVYIWNQNRTPGAPSGIQYSNLTPAWDPFQLPPLNIPPPEQTK